MQWEHRGNFMHSWFKQLAKINELIADISHTREDSSDNFNNGESCLVPLALEPAQQEAVP